MKGAPDVSMQLIAGISGLLIVIAVPLTVAIPYVLRRSPGSPRLASAEKGQRSFLARMRPHFWIGYLIASLTVIHALIATTGGITGEINVLGLGLAAIGLFVVVFQLSLGSLLTRPDVPERGVLRKVHFWTMCSLVALGLGHIILNGPTLAHLIK